MRVTDQWGKWTCGLTVIFPLLGQAQVTQSNARGITATQSAASKPPSVSVWPGGADGDVFRRLQKHGFDFSARTDIDFNVDFEEWPPKEAFVRALRARFQRLQLHPPGPRGQGYVEFVVSGILTYELVISTQRSVSQMAKPFGGVCDSWGVMQNH
ncbi:MAG TPA: ribonuclease E inhibitor RraB [Telluria sp.]|jgi:hypothetical protein